MEALTVDVQAMRQYCSGSQPASGYDVLTDAVVNGDSGAHDLVRLLCLMRVNERSRRTMGESRRT